MGTKPIQICAALEVMVFELFSSKIGYVFHSDLALDILFRMNFFFRAATLANL